jgi:hypothetical protein
MLLTALFEQATLRHGFNRGLRPSGVVPILMATGHAENLLRQHV